MDKLGIMFLELDKIFLVCGETGSHGAWFKEQTRDRPASLYIL